MKYLIILIVVFIVGAGGYIYKSNQADKKRLADAAQAYKDQQDREIKVSEVRSKISGLRDEDALMLVQSPKLSASDQKYYASLGEKWSDAVKVAESTARINLAQQVNNLQTIKRELDSRSTKSFCDAMIKTNLLLAYNKTIDSFLAFMQEKEGESQLNTTSANRSMDEAIAVQDYCNP